MSTIDRDPTEGEITQLAVQALTAAHRRAVASGRPVLEVVDGALVRKGPSGVTVLKKLPPRKKVTVRLKRASS
jgi:hypothetical protein